MENNGKQAISSDLIRGHIDTIILHTLLDGDKYAQQISDSVEEKSEKKYSINQATLYSSLKRLENLKFVKSYWFDVSDGRRKFFKITDAGRNEVDKNLSSWSFSRQIIDKLMDATSQDISYKTVNVSPTVFASSFLTPSNSNTNSTDKIVNNVVVTDRELVENNVKFEEKQSLTENISDDSTKKIVSEEKQTQQFSEEKEINFRNILSGLIKTTTIEQTEENIEKQKIDKIDEEFEKPKFNETITVSDYNSQGFNNNGKIDYGDLTSEADKNGYKIRISSKDSAKPFGNLYYNKLKFYTSVLFAVIVSIEVLLLSITSFNGAFKLFYAILPFSTVFAIALISLLVYVKNPLKTASKKLNGDKILTASIVAFNLFLLIFALNFLFDIDLEQSINVASYLIAPLIAVIDIVLYFILEFILSRLAIFHIKRN